MQKLAVLTSGGDAPGMNAAIRAVVRTAIYYNLEVYGVERGYAGLIEGSFRKMNLGSVADIIQRAVPFYIQQEVKNLRRRMAEEKALQKLREKGIEGLVVIGGDGSLRGALALAELGVSVIGIPGTIDNDIAGTDFTIGFDTAVNVVVEAINRARDTATSHERTFIIEVMGRNSGWIALQAGLAGGAESILVPEFPPDFDKVVQKLMNGIKRGKKT